MLRRGAPYLAGFLSGLLATATILLLSSPPRGYPIQLEPLPTLPPIQIHVAGAVARPGVYPLEPGAIVQDAINAAGGAQPEAALDLLNLAGSLNDGDKVVVPDQSALTARAEDGGIDGLATDDAGLLSLNQATEPELERLPGIGPSLAQAIVRFRQEHGPFESVEDLLNVPGIGPAKLEGVRDLVQVD